MKFALVLLAFIGLAQAMPTKSLKNDLDDFLALIPTEELKALYHKYENDEDIKKIVTYLKSSDFADVMHIIANVEEVQDLVSYLDDNGVPVVDFLNRLADRLGLPHWPGSYSAHAVKSTRTWRDFLEEAKKIVPLDKIAALVVDKLANSPDFQALYEKIANVDYQKLHDNALAHPEIKDMVDRLSALGVDLKKVWDFVKSFFGWSYSSFSTYSLKTDLNDFLALIPTEELKALYHQYENDEDIKKIVAYLKSSDFAAVMHIIANVEEVQDLVSYLDDNGVPVVDFLNRLADRLGLPHWPGSYSAYTVKSTRTWRDFLEAAKKLVPLDKIKALVVDKLANSPDFQALYEKIASVDYQKLHDNALAHPEIKDMVDRLSALGVDLKKVWDFVKSFFGWSYSSFSTYSLKNDLDDFLALIPTEELKALYHQYENDEDIKKIVAYLKSSDFAAVMHIIANVEEVQDLVSYLEADGVPVVDFLNRLADRLGLPHWPGSYSAYTVKSTRTWRDFLEAAKKLVPLDKITALVVDKLANSPDFQALYEKIASVDYQKLHDNALAHPEIKDMVDRLSALGVDLKKVWDFVKSFFGWSYSSFSTYSLKNDLDDFLALIPTEELKALYHQYENDEDIKKIVAYLKSSDFAAVMHIIANVEEVQDLVSYLEANGVPVVDFLNRLADRLGLPHWPGSYSAHVIKSTRTWRDFLEAAKKLVPLDKITALVVDKLANSPDFQALYEKIANVDYQKLHDNALAHPEIKDMVDRLSALGVDLKKVWDFVKSFFGWE